MDAGNAAEWSNAGVTAVALFAAGWAALSTHRTLQIERRRDRRRDMADEASQASLVAAWGVPVQRASPPWKFTVANNSPVPVYDVTVTFKSANRPDEEPTHYVGVLPPGDRDVPFPEVWVKYETRPGVKYVEGWVPGNVEVSVMFTDSTGMVWQRDERGQLRQVFGHDSMRFLREPVWPTTPAEDR